MIIKVICIDGAAASGKGTISHNLAKQCGYGHFNSGLLYRYIAYIADKTGLSPENPEIDNYIDNIDYQQLASGNPELLGLLSSEKIGECASIVSAIPQIRDKLVNPQRQIVSEMLKIYPMVVTDGRDMGTVIFPDAAHKFFLITDLAIRAERRLQQLTARNNCTAPSYQEIYNDLLARDARDSTREVAPLKPAKDAMIIDTGLLSVNEVVSIIIAKVNAQ